MSWNFDISKAPVGGMVTRRVTTSKGVKSFEEYEPVQIIAASKCGKVTRSYWLPREKRWCMFSEDSPPIAWQLWPGHPHEESTKTETTDTPHKERKSA